MVGCPEHCNSSWILLNVGSLLIDGIICSHLWLCSVMQDILYNLLYECYDVRHPMSGVHLFSMYITHELSN